MPKYETCLVFTARTAFDRLGVWCHSVDGKVGATVFALDHGHIAEQHSIVGSTELQHRDSALRGRGLARFR